MDLTVKNSEESDNYSNSSERQGETLPKARKRKV